ncbi:MAG: histidinol phosphatase [Chitinophagaceae bacterium]|nr:MAG: histidinol phosphatase [Chitinophagaceae bacterium]
MFNFFKKKSDGGGAGYFPITTDIHSHILPGIDDGSPDVDTSLLLIKRLMALGVRKSIATPHIIGDMYPNNSETISNALSVLRSALKERKIDFTVEAAAEYMLDGYFFELLQKRVPLLTVKDNLILTEFPYSTMPDYVERMSFNILTDGYTPILAHPERYGYAHGNYKVYHRWMELGFKLQVNLLSLTGHYGKEVAKAAEYLVKNELVSFVATDLHHERHLDALSDSRNQMVFSRVLGHKAWNEIF